jgi:hypothetical protein
VRLDDYYRELCILLAGIILLVIIASSHPVY